MKHLLALVGLVLLVASVAVLYPVVVPVLTGWVWVGIFGSFLTFVKVVAAAVVGVVGVGLVRASR